MKQAKILLAAALCLGFALGPSTLSYAKPKTALSKLSAGHISYPASVLELFTSQGCSSCPQANEFTRNMAQNPSVLTLSYSVDYWDYLGWKDTFGKPEFAARQRQYGKNFQGQVYTPQLVLNGSSHGARLSKRKVSKKTLDSVSIPVRMKRSKDGLKLLIATADLPSSATIMAVRYIPGEQAVSVAKGENRGTTMRLVNVVTACTKLEQGKGGAGFNAQIPMPFAGEKLAILLQSYDGGPIISAAIYTP